MPVFCMLFLKSKSPFSLFYTILLISTNLLIPFKNILYSNKATMERSYYNFWTNASVTLVFEELGK